MALGTRERRRRRLRQVTPIGVYRIGVGLTLLAILFVADVGMSVAQEGDYSYEETHRRLLEAKEAHPYQKRPIVLPGGILLERSLPANFWELPPVARQRFLAEAWEFDWYLLHSPL
jgi:hypothetical protein